MLNVTMNSSVAAGYKSASQIARRVTENWGAESLYCVCCNHELKASQKWSERRVPDAGYDAMVRALRSDRIPNLLVMQYSMDWSVRNLLIVPSFFFTLGAIEKRPPLGPNARRAGWVGCNILLHRIAPEGKIRIVNDGGLIPADVVRANYSRVRPLARLSVNIRGWTLDLLRLLEQMGVTDFDLSQAYGFEADLSKLHPGNRNIRPKIRQQLQVLRDLGFLQFLGRGKYRLVPQASL